MKRWLSVSLSLHMLLLGCSPANVPDADAPPPAEGVLPSLRLVAGVFPFAPAAQIDELYGPLVSDMAEQLDLAVQLRTASSFDKFSESLAIGEFDIAVVQPFDYPDLVDHGYRPIVRVEQSLRATLVAPTDLEFARPGIAGVTGLRIGTPPATSAIRLLLEAELVSTGVELSTLDLIAFATHVECLGQLQLDVVDVCAVAPVPLREFQATSSEPLQVVAVTEPVASIAFIAHPDLDQDHFLHIQDYLVRLDDRPDTQPLLDLVGTSRYVLVEDGDYSRVRELLALRAGE